MQLRNKLLSWFFVVVIASAVSAVSAKPGKPRQAPKDANGSQSFVIYQNELGSTICRNATEVERRQIVERGGGETIVIYPGAPLRGQLPYGTRIWTLDSAAGLILQPSSGLHIVLHGTAQLNANPTAKNAFIAAANHWESIISTPITVGLTSILVPRFLVRLIPTRAFWVRLAWTPSRVLFLTCDKN
jgi:hypothetical protein